MKKLTIDQAHFQTVFARDLHSHDAFCQDYYLDLETGHIVFVYKNDEDGYFEIGLTIEENQAERDKVMDSPERYLEIPGLSHGEHHEILMEFLDSDWTDDEELKNSVRGLYYSYRSIGRWKKSLDDESIFWAFKDFQYTKTVKMAEDFLHQHGVDFQWCGV